MHRWRYPSLSLHGIEGAFSASGAKTVIPRKVIGKFSIRLVPDMDPKVVEEQVKRLFVLMVHFYSFEKFAFIKLKFTWTSLISIGPGSI